MKIVNTTLIDFYRSLPDDFYIVDHDKDGYFCYPVEEGLAGLDWEDSSMYRDQVVLWNEDNSVALVADAHRPDPRCRILKSRAAIFVDAKGIGPNDSDPVEDKPDEVADEGLAEK